MEQIVSYSKTTTPRFNIIMAIITSSILALIFYYPLTQFFSQDTTVPSSVIPPERLKSFSFTQTSVQVGMYIKNFQEFNIVKGSFTLSAIVWFLFDPRVVSLTRLEKFTFEKAEIIKKSQPVTEVRDGMVLAKFDVQMRFDMPLNFSNFPFDDHRLIFSLVNTDLAPYEVIFDSSRNNLTLNPEVSVEGWTLWDKTVKTGYLESAVDPYAKKKEYIPRAIFSLEYKRTGIRHIISIIFPLLIIFFLSFFTFIFDPKTNKKYDVVNMTVTFVTGLIAYRFVIEALSPEAGYFMFSDYIFLGFLVAIVAILVTNIFFEATTKHQKMFITIVLHSLIIILFLYFIAPWR